MALARPPTSKSEPAPFTLPQLPELPSTLPQIVIDRLFVDALELGAPVLGEAATFTLAGDGGTSAQGNRADARLSLRRTDQPTAEVSLNAGLDLPAQTLSIDLQGSETGGLLAAATGRPNAGALRLSLEGDGPLANWQGRLAVEAERLAKLELTLHLAYGDRKQISVTGDLDASPGALPPSSPISSAAMRTSWLEAGRPLRDASLSKRWSLRRPARCSPAAAKSTLLGMQSTAAST